MIVAAAGGRGRAGRASRPSPTGLRARRAAPRPSARRSRPYAAARGHPHMTDRNPGPRSRRELDDGRLAVRDLELPGRVRRARAHAAQRSNPASRCCSSTRCITSPRPIAYRDELARRWGLNLVTLRAASRSPDCGARTRGLLRAPQSGAAVRARSQTTTSGSRACAAISHRAAPTCRRWSRSRCRPARCCGRSVRWRAGRRKRVWAYARQHDIPLLPLYAQATRASAASRARRCRSSRRTIGRAAGAGRSSSAGFTSSRSRSEGFQSEPDLR